MDTHATGEEPTFKPSAVAGESELGVKCLKCGVSNPETNRYCGQCGAVLNPTLGPLWDTIEGGLHDRLETLIRERFRDQKIVEVEIAESVVERVMKWTKNLAFFVGIPLVLLVGALTVWGIKSLTDFQKIITTKQADVERELGQEKEKQITAIKAKSDALQRDLEIRLAASPVIKQLEAKVEAIGVRIGFVPSKALTPEIQANIERAFSQFNEYLRIIGHDPGKPRQNLRYISAEIN